VFFKTKSDTEVILRLYEAYGIAFSMLDGMFASVFMIKTNKVLIARDFFGENLYYCKNSDSFIGLGNRLYKILPSKPAINKTALNLF
jgi:asparagine synthetase B (glutamine-hydrolysing)